MLLPDVEEAVNYIKQESDHDPQKFLKLSGVLYSEGGGYDPTTLKQFHLLKMDNAIKTIGIRLARKLELLHEQNPKRLQKEWEEVVAALEQLKAKRHS